MATNLGLTIKIQHDFLHDVVHLTTPTKTYTMPTQALYQTRELRRELAERLEAKRTSLPREMVASAILALDSYQEFIDNVRSVNAQEEMHKKLTRTVVVKHWRIKPETVVEVPSYGSSFTRPSQPVPACKPLKTDTSTRTENLPDGGTLVVNESRHYPSEPLPPIPADDPARILAELVTLVAAHGETGTPTSFRVSADGVRLEMLAHLAPTMTVPPLKFP